MRKYINGIGFYVILGIVIITVFLLSSFPETTDTHVYSELISMIKSEQVVELSVTDNVATAKLTDGRKIEVDIPSYSALYLR